ncbi:MAG: nucleotidyltransferase domain-containing protein [Candidatus Bathyarchaeota archaeon]|nr:nucleotidyltransferase domain-containing protein [Candidatus Bathyarchaeota archaeon]
MACLKLRDRDAIVTREGLIFRVFGYTHPTKGYICDAEYAPVRIFNSNNPKAFRTDGEHVFYKFYEDEGWKFVEKNYPQYMIFHKSLNKKVVGVKCSNIMETRRPSEGLKRLFENEQKDELLASTQKVLEIVNERAGLSLENFGVFGSLLHGFYHPKYSDIDLIVYGRRNVTQIRETLQELYQNSSSPLKNEFESDEPIRGKTWLFKNISPKEYVWHQKRKTIYAVFHDKFSKRTIKVEFEPVKEWNEIQNDYESIKKVAWKGWVKALARVKNDVESPFMPSVYQVEVLELLEGSKADNIERVISYLEEFRIQTWKDEKVYVEGNLEEVETQRGSFHQITLTYGPRYYEQVIKVVGHV